MRQFHSWLLKNLILSTSISSIQVSYVFLNKETTEIYTSVSFKYSYPTLYTLSGFLPLLDCMGLFLEKILQLNFGLLQVSTDIVYLYITVSRNHWNIALRNAQDFLVQRIDCWLFRVCCETYTNVHVCTKTLRENSTLILVFLSKSKMQTSNIRHWSLSKENRVILYTNP